MIRGVVRSRQARIRLYVRGPRKREQEIEAVVDTGFTASLSLRPEVIASLGLRWKTIGLGILADGSECLLDVYVATVVWDGEERRVSIEEADTDPLVGMKLLTNYELNMQVRSGGKLAIRHLPPRLKRSGV